MFRHAAPAGRGRRGVLFHVSEATGSEREGEALCRAALAEAEGDAVLEARIHTDLAEYLGRSTGLEQAPSRQLPGSQVEMSLSSQ